jgi:LysM repeat protein
VGDRLLKGEKLERGQSLTSRNGAYTLTLQDDGNLVRAEVQTDGNFVLYTPDKPVWHTDTKGAKDVRLLLQDDRNLVLYGFDGPAWSSNAQTDEAPPPPVGSESAESQVVPASIEEPVPAPAPAAPEPEAAPPPPPPPPPPPAPRTYTVVSGDTLWAIAERFYGDGSKYQRIADASGISNPDLIHPGQVLTIP